MDLEKMKKGKTCNVCLISRGWEMNERQKEGLDGWLV